MLRISPILLTLNHCLYTCRHFRVAGKPSLQTNYTNMFQETTFDMCCHHKSVDGLDKQSGFSIAAVAQNCSVALERVKASESYFGVVSNN